MNQKKMPVEISDVIDRLQKEIKSLAGDDDPFIRGMGAMANRAVETLNEKYGTNHNPLKYIDQPRYGK